MSQVKKITLKWAYTNTFKTFFIPVFNAKTFNVGLQFRQDQHLKLLTHTTRVEGNFIINIEQKEIQTLIGIIMQ